MTDLVLIGNLLLPRWLASVLVRSITGPKRMTQQERAEYDRAYYQANRDAILLRHRERYRANRDAELVKKTEYNKANSAAINLSQKIGLPIPTCRRMLENNNGSAT